MLLWDACIARGLRIQSTAFCHISKPYLHSFLGGNTHVWVEIWGFVLRRGEKKPRSYESRGLKNGVVNY